MADSSLYSLILATAEETEPVDSAGGLGIGAIALLAAVSLIMLWMGYLFVNSRRRRSAAPEPAPSNLSPPASDDELENKKLTVILRAALFGSALLAIAMPWYAFNEPDRQAEAAEQITELDVHEGEHWYSAEGFACADCHGPVAGGGAAAYTEERSGVDVSWSVPSLDDVFYRYGEDEVRYWIVFGRAGSPMPANGLEGGGAMTVQEVDQTIAYLQSIQISQADAFGRVGPAVDTALQRIEGGSLATQSLINKQQIEIDDVEAADSKRSVVGSFPDDIKDLFQAPGTCTATTAALMGASCDNPGQDTDRDGLSDETERELTKMAAVSKFTITVIIPDASEAPVVYSFEENPAYDVRFDPILDFTNTNPDTRQPWADLDAATSMLSHLETDVLLLNVTADREEQFLEGLEPGLDFLVASLADEPWAVDFDAVASDMGVSRDDAEEAVGLFNAYCARCHTAGYSAGPSFEQGAGSGAWGPALSDGRSVTQFPDLADHKAFIVTGSENAKGYGVNGIGSGRMPGFGNILSESQIELISLYERTM
ncbi:MAG: c-type cytochrome [Acidimicrobiia bacterium]